LTVAALGSVFALRATPGQAGLPASHRCYDSHPDLSRSIPGEASAAPLDGCLASRIDPKPDQFLRSISTDLY
jgi:hypothetical protein